MRKLFFLITVLIVSYVVYWVFFRTIESVYYVPEAKVYLRMKTKSFNNHGYVYFGRDSITVLDSTDYVKVHEACDSEILSIYYNPHNDTVYLTSYTGIIDIKQTHFILAERKKFDKTFLTPVKTSPGSYKLNHGYVHIEIYNFGGDLFVADDTSHLKKVLPANIAH
ncbi:hypothetical protein [Bacteroides sp.]|uniref:hypothetical protein n=1 Tax=Bacteroides sp. TaxID=29523 RepID=UPI00263A36A2|nr:hypothetical protein [Bacteroides sp.]